MTQKLRWPRRAAWALAALAIAWLPGPAQAADEATVIRRAIEHALASWRFREKITIDGRVAVSEEGDGFRIVLPGLAIEGGRPNSGRLDVGDVVIVAIPRADGAYASALTLPKTMGIVDEGGIVRAFIVIGGQRITGVWVPAIQTLTQADAVLEDVWVTEIGGASRGHMAAIALNTDLVERAPGLWDGPSRFRVADLEVTMDGEGALTLASIEAATVATGMRLEDQVRAFAEIGKSLGDEAGESPPPVEPLVILRLAEKSALVFDSMTTEVALNGLDYAPEAGDEGFALGRAAVVVGIEDLESRLARVRFHYEHDGFALADTGAFSRGYVPEHAIFDLVADKVPASELRESLFDYAAAPDEGGEARMASRLSAAAMDAETEVRLNLLAIEAPEFSLHSEGAFKSDRTAAQMVTGWLETTVRGLDGLRRSLSAVTGQAEAAQAMSMVMLLQSLGVVETDQTGAEVRRYRIEITPEGRTLLNGRDFAAVLGGAMGAPQQP